MVSTAEKGPLLVLRGHTLSHPHMKDLFWAELFKWHIPSQLTHVTMFPPFFVMQIV